MRRADRLFSILQSLRKGSVVRAADLAERLEVSERTIYRDSMWSQVVCSLERVGSPIDPGAQSARGEFR